MPISNLSPSEAMSLLKKLADSADEFRVECQNEPHCSSTLLYGISHFCRECGHGFFISSGGSAIARLKKKIDHHNIDHPDDPMPYVYREMRSAEDVLEFLQASEFFTRQSVATEAVSEPQSTDAPQEAE